MTDTITPNAAQSGIFRIGGELPVHRLGFGAMRITGEGVWGDPQDREEALATLRRVPELGVNLIDTADSYGPAVSEELIHEALFPYDAVVIATKGGLTRTGPNVWPPCGRPEYLIQQAYLSCRRLGVERIDLWQLHRIDPKVPRDEQFGAVRELLDRGVIRFAGLSEVNVEEIEAARQVFPVATVQNLYNLVNRKSEEVLDYCEREGIGFLPWYPLAAGGLAREGSVLSDIATRLGATPSQVALAWVLRRSPVMLPIPGTGKVKHLEENVAAAGLSLSDEDFRALDEVGRAEWNRKQVPQG
ncbi:aldo/keto reductase [Deinococcus geothermalis DSM 11300]|uniref:Aldo/keto reductase n=1 Tax=Deinococcus geothermalis (strain DSM 11300 / CIP 105573 / AG-3a) TaxID=319795 RepID=Q1IXQ4_DEIGD|nr:MULTISPECIES: aldo/keto reductase [Deinococcus]ABF45980.1 aldo/keto reductase [Deinococcus geothermalis DSM 11300]MBI0447027.1 oxidoreductase [Deinococcus sp. DB0503]